MKHFENLKNNIIFTLMFFTLYSQSKSVNTRHKGIIKLLTLTIIHKTPKCNKNLKNTHIVYI